ncbi:hypothetical protein M406DRAFT_295878 [Cryphonectria parasitica EP155]|uniref:Uncharacterized protein n=1 Tax=Cryphonectria parasitica (strain ATCC 38755 / EP155) TaxID=660469 RepID=A0A9P5CK27_CRYP1|nr:uncharacterized protein M406DRAFT_295878 [Cryphonectria parasitica EP155]KAF3760521.1 hypothetical protein M406DRAFT_295878 [Cryphonectria parasitica EP155]
MADTASTSSQWTFILALTALFLSAVVTLQILSSYAKAYIAAPAEILTFVDAADSSVHENESYDRDVSRLQRLDDKLRLGRLLGEIQRGGDDLREELNSLLMTENGNLASDGYSDLRDLRLRASARLLWASKRKGLEDKVRRLDMLRMRFLVVYMGIVSSGAADHHNSNSNSTSTGNGAKHERKSSAKDPEKVGDRLFNQEYSARPQLPKGLGEAIRQKPMLRRLSTTPLRNTENSERSRKQQGWAGVIRELQLSPLLHKRHASIERAMSPSPTLVGSPTPGSSP